MDEVRTRVNDDIELIQKSGGHLFGTDALLLAAFVDGAPGGNAVELGAGSGIISLLLAKRGKFAHIDAIEIQPDMADIAARNVRINGLEDRINVVNSDLRAYKPSPQMKCDAVFCNPPYIRENDGRHNPDPAKNASRREIFGTFDDFCSCAARLLNYGGPFYCVWRPERLGDLVDSMRRHSIEPKRAIFVYPDKSSAPCLVLCEGRRSGKSGSLYITAPFILTENGSQSADCAQVYERGEFCERYKRR